MPNQAPLTLPLVLIKQSMVQMRFRTSHRPHFGTLLMTAAMNN